MRYRLRTLLIVLALVPAALWLVYWAAKELRKPQAPAEGTILYHGAGPPTIYKSNSP
jgi:hypothetical protein